MSKQALEKKLEALKDLDASGLRKALRDANNFYVSKAAGMVESLGLRDLTDELCRAFDRFMVDGKHTDPKCWAKIALVRALGNLGHRAPDVYVRGYHCVQLEPIWGGDVDAGAGVRAVSAGALVDSELDGVAILRLLVKGLVDVDRTVRLETVRALLRLSRWEGELLIRQKALHGDTYPEVMGACFDAVLQLEQSGAVDFVAGFLGESDAMPSLEAAAALAQSKDENALEKVKVYWQRILAPEMRRTIAVALGASPLGEARDLLLEILQEQSGEVAACAVTGLASSRYREEVRARVNEMVDAKRDRGLAQLFQQEFG